MTEGEIARYIARTFLKYGAVCLLDRTKWTGYEADMLVVAKNLQIIDVEIKISRADFKRDTEKDKWWHRPDNWRFTIDGPYAKFGPPAPDRRKDWPPKVWKHYFAMPRAIWKEDLVEFLPSPNCGVILIDSYKENDVLFHTVHRRAKADKNAVALKPEDVIDIARLQNIRMWEAYQKRDNLGKLIHEQKTRGNPDVGDLADDRSH